MQPNFNIQPAETHHMVEDQPLFMQAADRFIARFPYTRFTRLDECIRYEIYHLAFANGILKEANKLITDNHLPLMARLQQHAHCAILIIEMKEKNG